MFHMIDKIRSDLKKLSCAELKKMSAEIGVSYDGLIKIRLGIVQDPKLSTALAIQSYFK